MPCSSEMISQNWTKRNKNQIDNWLINTALSASRLLLWWIKYINQSIDVSSCRVQRWGQVRDMNVCVYEIKEFIIINRKWPDIQAYLQNCQNVYTSKRNMAVIHSDVKAQLRCNENNFTTDCRHTVTPSVRHSEIRVAACRKYLIAIAEILFSTWQDFRTQQLL